MTPAEKKKEVVDRCNYLFRNMQVGHIVFPNSAEGDILKLAYEAIVEEGNEYGMRVQQEEKYPPHW